MRLWFSRRGRRNATRVVVPGVEERDPRDVFIESAVSGRSFADVGGLWGTENEKVSVADAAGAKSLAMIDLTSPEDELELWARFHERMHEKGIEGVDCISADVVELSRNGDPPAFDVVHCSGVLYHAPEPLSLLRALRAITRERLVLSSAVTATRIERPEGTLEIPNAAVLFLPALQAGELAIVRAHWAEVVGDQAFGLTSAAEWRGNDYQPWWWLPTVDALRALSTAAGFTVEDGSVSWNGNAYTLLLAAR